MQADVVPQLVGIAAVNEGLVRRAHLDAAGLSGREISGLIASGTLARVHRGVYRLPVRSEPPGEQFRAAVRAVRLVDPTRVLTGSAAAALHGLPVHHDAARIHGAVDARGGGTRRSVVQTVARPPDAELVRVGGAVLASPARAALDAARLDSVTAGVVIADAALARGLARSAEITAVLAGMSGLTGIARSRVCAEVASAGSESPGESWSAVVMHVHGLPAPVRQHAVRDGRGAIGRVDFWWPEARVAGEFDGRVKYGMDNPGGRPPEEVLWAEKAREDRMRALGLAVVRWTTADLRAPGTWIARLRRALTS